MNKKFSGSAARHELVGPGGVWQVKRRFQFEFLVAQGLRPNHGLLDIGCGTLRGGLPLIRLLDEGNYSGIEARKEALDAGLIELSEAGLAHKSPTLVEESRFRSLRLARRFDFVWAFSVLFHMDDQTVSECIQFVERHLQPEGIFFANVNIGTEHTGKWKNFVLARRPLSFYRNIADAAGLVVQDLGTLKELGHDLSEYAHLLKNPEAHHLQRMLRFTRANDS